MASNLMIRIFDIFISILVIFISLPIIIFVCIFNSLTSEKEVFYLQDRIGKNSKKFKIFKFATMLIDSEKMQGGGFTDLNDYRLLPLGSFMRRTKINELPQLFNVLKGEMSLVGFRPLSEASFLKAKSIGNEEIYSVLPGITSAASIILRNEEQLIAVQKDKEEYYFNQILPLKVSLDAWWKKNKNLYNYFAILFLTSLILFLPLRMVPISILKDLPKNIKIIV